MQSQRGFTFLEILFAIMILGIGMIMVAAIFPVAIRQTQSTIDETVAATTAKGAFNLLAPYVATGASLPTAGGTCLPIGPDTTPAFWFSVGGNAIGASDPRYAWAAFYMQCYDRHRRSLPYAQLTVIAMRVRNRSVYQSSVDQGSIFPPVASTFEGRELACFFTYAEGKPDQVSLYSAGNSDYLGAAAEGAFVIVGSDGNSQLPNANGYIYRLGNEITSATGPARTFELAPGSDSLGATYRPSNATVYIVGAGQLDPTDPDSPYEGGAQDIAAYTTYLGIR